MLWTLESERKVSHEKFILCLLVSRCYFRTNDYRSMLDRTPPEREREKSRRAREKKPHNYLTFLPQAQHFSQPENRLWSNYNNICYLTPSQSHDDYCNELDSILVVNVCAHTKREIVRDYRRPRVKSVCGRAGAAALIIVIFI